MEKLDYYLIGKKFTLISDHKALEEIHNKKDFGTPRIQRWLERFSRFNFDVCYRMGEKLVQADALSRVSMVNKNNHDGNNLLELILNTHKNNGHRKIFIN
ncbi:Retrovirus-related Pol polyprotein from transposon [Dictyocoela muelleri]|nr:Retrovirus-related Pol polyprotein from transposon [Dictyocoela muelleri]